MDALLKVEKMNKKKTTLSSSMISRTSFGSLLEEIRQSQNGEDEQTNSQFSTPKAKNRQQNQQKKITKNKSTIISSIQSSEFDFIELNQENQSNTFKKEPKNQYFNQNQQETAKHVQKQQKFKKAGPSPAAVKVLQKLGKSYATQNSSTQNASISSLQSSALVLNTSYVNKSKTLQKPIRKIETDKSNPLRKSFATNFSDYDSELMSEDGFNQQGFFNDISGNQYLDNQNLMQEKPQRKNIFEKQVDKKQILSQNLRIVPQKISPQGLNKNSFKNQIKNSNNMRKSLPKDIKKQSQPPKTFFNNSKPINNIPKSQIKYNNSQIDYSSQSEEISNLARKFRNQREGTALRSTSNQVLKNTKSSLNTKSKNLYTMTGRRVQAIRQYTIAILQYCSHQIGLACYNNTTGEFHLCQLIQNLTYFRTLSTIQAFSPSQIIYSSSFQKTLLIKRLKDHFRMVSFKGVFRRYFDQQTGYKLYLNTPHRQNISPNQKFLALACFNALLIHLETTTQNIFRHESLSVKWHRLDRLLIIEPDAIADLQIFYNFQSKKNQICLIQHFHCITSGGTRMLRSNFLQPPSQEKIILERQKLVQKMLENPSLVQFISKQLYNFKFYEPITARFVKTPKQKNFKSLKSYLTSIFQLSKQCLSIQKLYKLLQQRNSFDLPIFEKLDAKLQSQKLKILKMIIEQNFDQQILKNFEQMKNKRDRYIFLFKVEKIQDGLADVTRQVYKQTCDTIRQYFEALKTRTNEDIHLMFNQSRGYFLKVKQDIDLQRIAQKIHENLVQVTYTGKFVCFSTQILSSLNNRIQQSQKVLVYQSQSLLRKVISQIQQNIDILFEINQILSTIDMIISFVKYINRYSSIQKFIKPKFSKGINKISIVNLKPVWEIHQQNLDEASIDSISLQNQDDNQNIVLLQKSLSSYKQNSYVTSTAYTIILSQVGCFIPAQKVELSLFDSMLSKIQIRQSTQNGFSRFQLNMIKLQNIFDNCFLKNSGKTLVLMDEIVRGTQHEEECALALATIKQLQKNKGLSLMMTSDRMLIQFLKYYDSFKSVRILRTNLSQIEQKAIEEISKSSVKIMRQGNIDEKFIQFFEQINIEPVYTKLEEDHQGKKQVVQKKKDQKQIQIE